MRYPLVGADPDVLAFDKAFGRLYVSAESGVISIFDERGKSFGEDRRRVLCRQRAQCRR